MLRDPAPVERIDVAEDAVGRVAIFTMEPPAGHPRAAGGPPAPPGAPGRLRRVSAVIDEPLGALILAVVLVAILIVGLRLTH